MLDYLPNNLYPERQALILILVFKIRTNIVLPKLKFSFRLPSCRFNVQCRIHKGPLIIPILSSINPTPRIDTHFFKVHSNIVLLPKLRLSFRSPFCRFTVQCRIQKGSPTIPILSSINPTPRIDTYFFKVHSNSVLPLSLGLSKLLFPVGLLAKVLRAVLPSFILTT